MASKFNIDVDVPKVVMIGGVSLALLVVTFLTTHAYYLKFEHEEFTRKYYDAPNPLLKQIADDRVPDKSQWIDRGTNTAQIKIDDAIRIMVQTKGKPPTTQPFGVPLPAGTAGGT